MFHSRFAISVVFVLCVEMWMVDDAAAQRLYSGSTLGESQYSGGTTIDPNGRANADGRALDRYGMGISDYGSVPGMYQVPGHAAGASNYSRGYYYPGGYSGLGYTTGIGASVGVGAYSGGYYSTAGRFGNGLGTTYISPPRTVVVPGVYNSRTVMNNATRGGVVEYTNSGNGYIYSPGTSSQTVVSTGPSIFPTISVVQPSQPAALIETRPTQPSRRASKTFHGSTISGPATVRPVTGNNGNITLMYPKDSAVPMSFVLNGTVYSIKPGYSQSFLDDRVWTIEFLRGGSGSQPMRYELKEGTYQFIADENGWDLKAVPVVTAPQSPLGPTSTLAPLAPPSPSQITLPAPSVQVPAPVPSPDF